MRKLYVFNMVSLNGFFEGVNRDLSWHRVDAEFNNYAIEQLNNTGLLLFGRITYELMAGYWPTEQAMTDDPTIAGAMNMIPKIVFSRTLKQAHWNNTSLIQDHCAEEVQRLKLLSGKDIAIFGSSRLAVSLMQSGLVDEYRIMVNPVVLGDGTPLFHGMQGTMSLKLLETKVFMNGNVLMSYQPIPNGAA